MSRSVLVTGSSRGIGAAIAQAFAGAGDRVAVHYATARETAEETLAALPGSGHVLVGGDLGDPSAVAALVDGVDVLVNNAGIFVPHPILDVDYDAWQEAWSRTIAVNLLGPANASWCAVRHLRSGGRIVNVSSRGAFRGEPKQPAYGASKAGLVALGQSLARSLGPVGISVTTVAPGYTETDMAAETLAGPRGAAIRAESPLGRVARASEVAAAVLYLASAEAEMASGAVLDLNGASYLR